MFSEERMLKLYFKIRMMEEDKNLTEGQKVKLISDSVKLYNLKGLSRALDRFGTIVTQPFDSPGSLSYVNDRFQRAKEDR